jgi:hypothetical protein
MESIYEGGSLLNENLPLLFSNSVMRKVWLQFWTVKSGILQTRQVSLEDRWQPGMKLLKLDLALCLKY